MGLFGASLGSSAYRGGKLKLVEGDLAQVVANSASIICLRRVLYGVPMLYMCTSFCVSSLLPRLESVARILYAFLVLFCLYVLASHHVFAWAIVLVAVAYLLFRFGQLAKVSVRVCCCCYCCSGHSELRILF